MSYGEWGNSPPPRRSSFGFGRLLLFALLAFIALRFISAAQQREQPAPPLEPAPGRIELPPIEAPRNMPAPKKNADNDWEMSAEPARPNETPAVKPAPRKPPGANGDWEMENVPSPKKPTATKPTVKTPATKTEEGDWKIEEVK
jgi:hypothetical protein